MVQPVVRVRLHRGAEHRDVAVDARRPLVELLPWLSDLPVSAVLDGERRLDLSRSLGEQGVLDGTDLRLQGSEHAPTLCLAPAE